MGVSQGCIKTSESYRYWIYSVVPGRSTGVQRRPRLEVAPVRTLVAPGAESPTMTYVLPRAAGQRQNSQTHGGEMTLTRG